MDAVVITLMLALVAVWFWLNLLGTLAARHDVTLDSFQRKAQIALVWLVPFVGASLVLFLVAQHYLEAIPRKWVPWPFRGLVRGTERARNQCRDENQDSGFDLALGHRRDNQSHGDSRYDGGGSND